jgi:uncharacterized protein (DUF1499 family)
MESLEAKVLAMIAAIIVLVFIALLMLIWRNRLRQALRALFTVIVLLVVAVIAIFAIAPRFSRRFSTAMTQHEAQTSAAPEFPELKTRIYNASREQVFKAAVETASSIPKWTLVSQDATSGIIKAVWTSTVRQFRDDITITIHSEGSQARVEAHSISREGKGDIGMNRHHLKTFLEALDQRMKAPGA